MCKKTRLTAIILLAALLLTACTSVAPTAQTPRLETPGAPAPPQPPASSTTPPVVPPSSGQPLPPPAAVTPPPVPEIPEGVSIGNRAIDFELQTLDGQTVKLSSLRGKPVLLNFWATWCGPCKYEMPFLQQIHDKYSSQGLKVLEIDINEKPETVQKYLTDNNLTMTVPLDVGAKVAKSYGLTAIPSSFLIDKDGIIRQKVIGAFPNVAAIENELSKIMP